MTIEGNENIIILEAEVLNMIINGNKNQINVRHSDSYLENVIINGNNNKISASNPNFIKINNGNNNTVNNGPLQTFQFGNGNMNVFNNFNNANVNIQVNNQNMNQFTNIADIINMVTANVNIEGYEEDNNNSSDQYNNSEEDSNSNYDGDSNDNGSEEEDDNNNINNSAKKRQDIILNLNEFQYKHVNKYLTRNEDKCAICFEKFFGPVIVKQFACGEHIFHKTCLFKWLKTSNICPLCKYDLNKGILKENIDVPNVNSNWITKSNAKK